jgi:uncharacterized membrane protein YagU involved in acid resistance
LITRRHLTTHERLRLGTSAHYAFSAALGTSYLVLAQFAPAIRLRWGLVYGTAVWAVADEGAMPGLGLSRGPRQLPIGVHLYSLLGHWVFGATLESMTRLAALPRRERQWPLNSPDSGGVIAVVNDERA